MRAPFAVGVLSGTSVDGIDVAVVDVRKSPQVVAARTFPYRKKTQEKIRRWRDLRTEEIGRLHVDIGEEFGLAVNRLLKSEKIGPEEISVIGSHGQTIYHEAGKVSLQLGAPAVIAERTNIPVAADFRLTDVAAGGEGAPFIPVLDTILFARHGKGVRLGALNIGGISNITVIDNGDVLRAYDIGPGNSLLDTSMLRFNGRRVDRGGRCAARGEVLSQLLEKALAHPYFRRRPPKSTGVEEFGSLFLDELLTEFRESSVNDVLRTMIELTVRTIAAAVKKEKCEELWISGGGLKNAFLCSRLREELSEVVFRDFREIGVEPDYKEALLFGYLGDLRLKEKAVDLRHITGSKKENILGGLWLP